VEAALVELLHSPGFFGTKANWAADFTLLMGLIIAALFTVGFYLARQGKYEAHRWVQSTAVLLNLILVFWLMLLPFRDFVAAPDNPAQLPAIALAVTRFHGLIGGSGLIFGTFVALRGNGLMIKPLRFNNYKLFMRIAYGLYMAATLIGIIVYITWFVTNPGPAPVYE
jgi:hypothetical protein